MALGIIIASIVSFALVWSALPRAQFLRLLLDNRGGPGDGQSFDWKAPDFVNAVGEIASQAISGRTKSLKKEIVTEIGSDFDKRLSAFGEQLAQKFTGLEQQVANKRDKKAKGEGGEPDDDAGNKDPMANPAFRTMQKQIEELKASNERLAREREAEVKKTRGITVRARLREALEKNGIVEPHKIKALSAILIDQERKVDFAESLEDAAGIDTDGAAIDLDVFMRGWLSSEEGQHWAPPKGAAGTGARPRPNVSGRPVNGQPIEDVGEILADAVRRGEI